MHYQTIKLSCKKWPKRSIVNIQKPNSKTAPRLFCFLSIKPCVPTKQWPTSVTDFLCHVTDQGWHPKWPGGWQCPSTDRGQKKEPFISSLLCPRHFILITASSLWAILERKWYDIASGKGQKQKPGIVMAIFKILLHVKVRTCPLNTYIALPHPPQKITPWQKPAV